MSRCRFCGSPLEHVFADLGMSPVSNDFRRPDQAEEAEIFLPLKAFVCGSCKLVQLQDFRAADQLFTNDYAYFSSFSDSWLRHASAYVEMACQRFNLGPGTQVVEVASNDGYLLRWFKDRGIPVLGVEPCGNVADAAERNHGIRSIRRFFGRALAEELKGQGVSADLMLGNNVLAHVPDINDLVAGFKVLLKPDGNATFEFPHLLRLIEENQFDTIYHEHFSYLSLLAVERIFLANGLRVYDVAQLPTHGGSLRIFVCHAEARDTVSDAIVALRAEEAVAGLEGLDVYGAFGRQVMTTKRGLLRFLIDAKEAGASIVGYGAPAKGNTLLNYCGIRTDFLDYTVDRSPHKQGMRLPGTGIEICAPEKIFETRPDYVLTLPWNLSKEITEQMSGIRGWGGKFVVPIPRVTILN